LTTTTSGATTSTSTSRAPETATALNQEGARTYTRASYPIRYGRYHELRAGPYSFQFNLNAEINRIQVRGDDWHPGEWLKRTAGGDWVYYSADDYSGLFDLFGEHYVPCLSYPSNSAIGERPFRRAAVRSVVEAWPELVARAIRSARAGSREERQVLDRIARMDAGVLAGRADRLHRCIGGRVTVLPPDTRLVDYDVVPVTVADGCLYHCDFCRVKARERGFRVREWSDVRRQLGELRALLGADLGNYASVFLGQHDALAAGRSALVHAAEMAYCVLELERSFMRGPSLFLFGSVGSLLDAGETLFESLNALPYSTLINIGLESADQQILDCLGKPVQATAVAEAFSRAVEINRRFHRIEVTVNFVWGPDLPPRHTESMLALIRSELDRPCAKGTVYLSPLVRDDERRPGRRAVLREIHAIQNRCRLPVLLYLIQRL